MMWLFSDEPCDLLLDPQDKWKNTDLREADILGSLDVT